MGPPIEIGGNRAFCAPAILGAALQWGHRSKSVETRHTAEVVRDRCRDASMGPPIEIGGNSDCQLYDLFASRSFNGATDRNRWKLDKRFASSGGGGMLQWGHRSKSVETARFRSGLVWRPSLQWGHRSKSVETGLAFPWCDRSMLASMGPPIEIGGNPIPGAVRRTASGASMGPPIEIGGNFHAVP